MLKLSGQAEVRAVVLRKEFNGQDDPVKAVTVKLHFEGVPLKVVEDGFVSQLSLFYGDNGDSQLAEIEELRVSRVVEDADVTVAGVELRGKVRKVVLAPRGGRTVDVSLAVSSEVDSGLDDLHDALLTRVKCSITERAVQVAEDLLETGTTRALAH